VSGVAKIVVYPSLPVRVWDGVGWVDDDVSVVWLRTDGCPVGGPYFYVRGIAGHWHLSEYGRTWEVRRLVEGSLEQLLTGLLGRELPGETRVASLVEAVVEPCVVKLDCGIIYRREEVPSAERT